MPYDNRFLPNDQKRAEILHANCQYSILMAERARQNQFYEQADELMHDYEKYNQELEKMKRQKIYHDASKRLGSVIVDVTIISEQSIGKSKGGRF